VRVLISALIPGFYFFTIGAPLRGALFLCGEILSVNLVLLLYLVQPFNGREILVIAAAFATAYFWAFNILISVLVYKNRKNEIGQR